MTGLRSPLRPGGEAPRGRLLGLVSAVLAAVACLPYSAAAQATSCDPAKAAERFPSYAAKRARIGTNPTYPPFSYTDSRNPARMRGLDVDIVEHAMRCAGLEFEYTRGQTSGLYPALFSGTLDVMLGNIFIRPDRVDRAGFVLFMINGQSVVVTAGNPKRIVSTDGMCGNIATGLYVGTSAIVVKSISENCVASGKPSIEYIAASDQEQAYRSLANGRSDMVMDGAASAAMRVKSSEGNGLEVAFTLQTDIKSGLIVPKGNREMLAVLENGLRDLQASGQLKALMARHGLQPDWLIPVEVHP